MSKTAQDSLLVTERVAKFTRDTWQSIEKMVDKNTSLVCDRLTSENQTHTSSPLTSPTNIGLFIADVIAAYDLELISAEQTKAYLDKLLDSLQSMERYRGFFYNWYSTTDRKALGPKHFISTVDNAWLIAGLITLKKALPEYTKAVDTLLKDIDYSFLYDPEEELFFGGFDVNENKHTAWHYGLLTTEARIAAYIGMTYYQIPDKAFKKMAHGGSNNEVTYPSWGGSLFEVLMPTLFVNEQKSPTWTKIHLTHIQKQIKAGETNNGFWGFSPCDNPQGKYTEFGVSNLALKPGGYGSGSIITPHAIFLSLMCAPLDALMTLERLEDNYTSCYTEGLGFADSVDTQTGESSKTRLALDQSMSFLAIFNYQTQNKLHQYFNTDYHSVFSALSPF